VDCAKATATSELNFCSEQELAREDAALNAVYKKVLAKIAASDQQKPYDAKAWEKALRESQRAWVQWRDTDCKGLIPFDWTAGTATTGSVLGCMSSKTKERAKDLRERFEVE
jgi:uncharacterized protein YecT (DUF1311 family)